MGLLNLALWGAGVALIVIGYTRARGPLRYNALKEQDADVARYEAWRGGTRGGADTGASVAMQILDGGPGSGSRWASSGPCCSSWGSSSDNARCAALLRKFAARD